LDGFVVDKNALEVATDIVEAMNEDEMDEEDEKEE
jgi:hypothetical protein